MDNSGQILQMSEIQMNYSLLSDEDEDEVDIECYTTSQDLLMRQDMISNSLVESGTIHGMAAAAALATARRRNKNFKFEIDPAVRRRQQTRLMRKLKQILNELCSRCGLQAVVLSLSQKGKENPTFKVTGSHPLDQAVRACQSTILREFEKDLQAKVDSKIDNMNKEDVFELPNLVVDGIPTSIDRMNQAQLRMFIPEMLKYATGRGKPGWGKDSFKPMWWPKDVPWANVRRDVRLEHIKNKIPWSTALRQIVRNCYRFHSREELLQGIVTSPCERDDEDDMTSQLTQCHRLKLPETNDHHHQQHDLQNGLQSPTFVHTVHNADGSVALVQVDSGQTIATIQPDSAGNAMATLSASHHHHHHHSVVPSDGSGGNGQVVGSSRAELHHNLHHHDDDDDDMDEGTWTITTEDPHHHHHHHHHDYDVISTNDQLISGEGLELRTSDVNRVSTTGSPSNNHHDLNDDVDDVTYDHHHMDFFQHHHHNTTKLPSSSRNAMLTSSNNDHTDDVILATDDHDDLMTSSQQQQQRIDYQVTIEHDGDLIDDEDDDVTIN